MVSSKWIKLQSTNYDISNYLTGSIRERSIQNTELAFNWSKRFCIPFSLDIRMSVWTVGTTILGVFCIIYERFIIWRWLSIIPILCISTIIFGYGILRALRILRTKWRWYSYSVSQNNSHSYSQDYPVFSYHYWRLQGRRNCITYLDSIAYCTQIDLY